MLLHSYWRSYLVAHQLLVMKRCYLSLLVIGLCALQAVYAVPISSQLAQAPLKPQDDPFFVAPPSSALAKLAPGHIIRSRAVTTLADAEMVGSAYQLLYRTNDHAGRASAAVTTTLLPRSNKARKLRGAKEPTQLVAYEAFEDSVALNCATSYGLQVGPEGPNYTPIVVALPVINELLSHGFTVTVPDFEGLKSEFIVGKTQGRATLDGIRATLRHKLTVQDPAGAQVGLIGYSGGASGGAWAAELAPIYAPEIPLLAGALGGIPVNPINILKHIDGTKSTGLALMGILGEANAYPEQNDYILARATEKGNATIQLLRDGTTCQDGLNRFANTSLSEYFNDFEFDDPVLQRINQENTLGQHTPTVPLYIFQATADDIVVGPDVDAYVKKQCARGARILYSRDTRPTHNEELAAGLPGAIEWLERVFAGQVTLPKAGQCVTTTHPTNMGPPTVGGKTQRASIGSRSSQSRLTEELSRIAHLPFGTVPPSA